MSSRLVPFAAAGLSVAFGLASAGPAAAEMRCGWFANPTPANAWLTNRDGRWIISAQGGHSADGDWPDFQPHQWVRQGPASYGYGCACLDVVSDAGQRLIFRILSARTRPLSVCRGDPALAGLEG